MPFGSRRISSWEAAATKARPSSISRLGNGILKTGITGFRRGGSIVLGPNQNSTPQTYSFSGDIASLAGPDSQGTLSHFMGSANPNIVIGANSAGPAGTHNIFRDTPLNPTEDNNTLQNQLGATYHVGIGSGPIEPIVGQNSATLHGFAAGFAQQPGGGAPHILGNFSPSDVTLISTLDAARNTLTASFEGRRRSLCRIRCTILVSATLAGRPLSTTVPSLQSRRKADRAFPRSILRASRLRRSRIAIR